MHILELAEEATSAVATSEAPMSDAQKLQAARDLRPSRESQPWFLPHAPGER